MMQRVLSYEISASLGFSKGPSGCHVHLIIYPFDGDQLVSAIKGDCESDIICMYC